MPGCRPDAMMLRGVGGAAMKLLWFFCYRLRLLPYGWQRRSGETIFPRKRAYCSGPAEVVVGSWRGRAEAAMES